MAIILGPDGTPATPLLQFALIDWLTSQTLRDLEAEAAAARVRAVRAALGAESWATGQTVTVRLPPRYR